MYRFSRNKDSPTHITILNWIVRAGEERFENERRLEFVPKPIRTWRYHYQTVSNPHCKTVCFSSLLIITSPITSFFQCGNVFRSHPSWYPRSLSTFGHTKTEEKNSSVHVKVLRNSWNKHTMCKTHKHDIDRCKFFSVIGTRQRRRLSTTTTKCETEAAEKKSCADDFLEFDWRANSGELIAMSI